VWKSTPAARRESPLVKSRTEGKECEEKGDPLLPHPPRILAGLRLKNHLRHRPPDCSAPASSPLFSAVVRNKGMLRRKHLL